MKMRKIFKQWVIVLVISIFMTVPTAAASVIENEAEQPEGALESYVYDMAQLLTADEMVSLDRQILEMKEDTGWDIFAATTDDAGGKSAKDYADDFYDAQTSMESDGILVLIDMDNRELYVSTCGIAIRYLTDVRIERVLDAGYSYISEGEYAECFSAMLEKTAYYYEAGIVDNQYNYDVETGAVSKYHSLTWSEVLPILLFAVGAGLGVYFFVVRSYTLKGSQYDYPYMKYGTLHLTENEDRFLRAHTTHQRIPRNDERGGPHGGGTQSSVHTSSGGQSHGGGGRKF